MAGNGVEEAIKKAGSQSTLAANLGIKQANISRWLKRGVVPPRKVLLVESLTGVPRQRLNPEIYPFESSFSERK